MRTLVQVVVHANGEVSHYWSDGLVSKWLGPGRWAAERVPEPEAIDPAQFPMEPNRELSPEVADD